MHRLIVALVASLLIAPPVTAEESRGELALIVDDMRAVNTRLTFARKQLDEALDVTGEAPRRIVSRAQVEAFAGDHPAAAALLLDLVSRPGIERHPAYAEAQEWLGESLWALGLERAAVAALRDALGSDRQSPSDWRRRFARYLERARDAEPLDRLRAFWQRAMSLPPGEDTEIDDGALDYHYGRALFRGGALAEADAAFRQVPADAEDALRARYFIGVVALKQGDLVAAAAAFEEARTAWQTRVAELPLDTPTPLDDIDLEGPARDLRKLTPDGDLVEPGEEAARRAEKAEAVDALDDGDDDATRLRRMGAVIHLALARLAAGRDDDEAAWTWYRRVPPGDPDYAEALSEATFVLFRMGRYDWCVRLVDQLLAERGDDMSAAQLGLWRAQLLARAAKYEEARASYELIEAAMTRRLGELDAELGADERLFPPAALAWTAPDDARRARRIEAELVLQGEAIVQIRALIETLSTLARSAEELPVVREGRLLSATLTAEIDALAGRLAAAPMGPQAVSLAGSDAPGTVDRPRVDQSLQRLRGRLAAFDQRLSQYSSTYRARLSRLMQTEVPAAERLARAVESEQRAARRLADGMRVAARQNIETFAGEALFGQVDLAWWRKEEVSRRIQAAADERDAAQAVMDAAPGAEDEEAAASESGASGDSAPAPNAPAPTPAPTQ